MIRTNLEVSLEGFEVGFSGAVPERKNWTEIAQDRGILEFVSLLSGLVFKYGGRVVHGAHPTFTPVILRQAELHAQKTNRPAVTICMSDLWAKDLRAHEKERFERESEFIVVPQVMQGSVDDAIVRNVNLTAMRRVLTNQMNTLVAIGGMQHQGTLFRPGVAEEIALAQDREMACFVIGGFGGEAGKIAEILNVNSSSLRNGLSQQFNDELLTSQDVATCAGRIFDHISRNRQDVLRPLKRLA